MPNPNTARTNTRETKRLVNVDLCPAQLRLSLLDLLLQFVVRLRDVVEGHDCHAQPAQKVTTKRYQGVERKL